MQEVNRLLKDIPIPPMLRARQSFDRERIAPEEIPAIINGILSAPGLAAGIHPGMRIALTAGSREICNITVILAAVADSLKARGAHPFLIPAMGSHGGATAEGQRALLESYQITEASCGCPILSSMETVCVGVAPDGQEVFLDRNAAEADGILVVGRIKPHTGFRGPYESGIMKMMVIGLGKQKGAEACHRQGFGAMAENLERFGQVLLQRAKILGAVAILENAFDQTYRLIGLAREEIARQEPALLKQARDLMPKILLPECDVLIVDEIGKNISGTGMDPNVTGRHVTPYCSGGLAAEQIAVLRLSEKTHGNGYGIGQADYTTKKVASELDLSAMYINGLTCQAMNPCHIPGVMDSEKLAIQACIQGVHQRPDGPRIIRIHNTLQLEKIWVSENLSGAVKSNPRLEAIGPPAPMAFDEDGFLLDET